MGNEENLDLASESVLVPVPTDRPSITVKQAGTYANMVLTGEPIISIDPFEEEKKQYIYKKTVVYVQDDAELDLERSETPVKVDKDGFTEFISKKEIEEKLTVLLNLLKKSKMRLKLL